MHSISERMAGMAAGPKRGGIAEHMSAAPSHEHEEGGDHTELHPHGDGTYHTVAGGEKTEHPHIGHAMMHMAMHHEGDSAHSHVMHHEGGGHTSHHAKDGQVSGRHDHENMEALKQHMDKFLGEEEQEGSGSYGGEHGGSDSLYGE